MRDYEKLGAFYLGRTFDLDRTAVTDEPLLYDGKDLTTHAVCVGMTGSGKTGLCVTLLEEAAIDGIPVIAIDPKGDLGNLMLTFPKLRPADFEPWVDPAAATRAGMSTGEYAEKTAAMWKQGLQDWDQRPQRIARLRNSADVAIYTPGSTAGLPLTVLRKFSAPGPEITGDAEALRDRIQAAVSGLLALLGLDADPLRSRDHILLSNILHHAWSEGTDLDLPALITTIQTPPFSTVGVFDLESFYPAGDRFGLAMQLNNLLASPGFQAWMEGQPLEVKGLLYTADGRPRISVLSIAHLSDAERMFFVTLLLNEVLAWMRAQPGTTSLRAILYMDEVFGYLPPTAAPPSKKPMLTLLKQARAFGLGVVLATQNPVDLDYKGLSNTGTWFLGRLQTERDKARVLEGLEGAAAASGTSLDMARMDEVLSGLKSRVFLMNNVHDDEPTLFHTRWALSYLRGPLTRDQVKTLTANRRAAPAGTATAAAAAVPRPTPLPAAATAADTVSKPPPLPPDVPLSFLAATVGPPDGGRLLYRPAVLGSARLHFVNRRTDLDEWREVHLLAPFADDGRTVAWDEATALADEPRTRRRGESGASYGELPAAAARSKSYTSWRRRLAEHLYRSQTKTMWRAPALKAVSEPDESEGEFRVRLRDLAREHRDQRVEKLRKRYAPKLERIQDRIRRCEARLEREQSQASQQKMQTAISIGATVLGALFGRKLTSRSNIGRATTAMRGAGRISREHQDVERAREELAEQQRKLGDLEAEFEDAIAELEGSLQVGDVELDELEIRPRKSDVSVSRLDLAWTPWVVDGEGIAEPAYL